MRAALSAAAALTAFLWSGAEVSVALRAGEPDWNRFATGLEASVREDGTVESLRGGRHFAGAPDGFDSADEAGVAARASEILNEIRPRLGLAPSTTLGAPIVQAGEVSAQVFFRQERDGIPLAPVGGVTLDLGSRGELVALYADVARSLAVEEAAGRGLSREEAAARALVAVPSRSGEASGGEAVIWAPPGAVGRAAYDFSIEGIQVVIDASSGLMLAIRDRRYRLESIGTESHSTH